MNQTAGHRLRVLMLCMLGISVHGQLSAVNWHNLSDFGCNTTSAGITTDVYNQNIDVQGTNALVGPIHVVASSADIIITVTTNDSVITASGNRCDNVTVTPTARLYLFAGLGRTITFSMTDDLIFRGTNDKGTAVNLLVSVSGGGSVDFQVMGGHLVTFTSNPTTGGARLYTVLGTAGNNPSVVFERLPSSVLVNGFDSEVQVGGSSIIGFVSSQATVQSTAETGEVVLDAANSGTGRLTLRVRDGGNVLVSPRFNNAVVNDYTLNNVVLTQIAGGQAAIVVANSLSPTSCGGPQVINQNTQQTNYASNPFCDGSFAVTGTQFGFILGANGIMQVAGQTYLDYIGLSTNYCPPVFLTIPPELQDILTLQSIVKARNPSAFIVDGSTNILAARPIVDLGVLVNIGQASGVYFRSGCNEFQQFVPTFTIDPLEETLGAGNIVFDVEAPLSVRGTDSTLHALHVLSIQTTPTGGQIVLRSGPNLFPSRTFATDSSGNYLQYNKGCMLNNSRIIFDRVSLVHDDQIHIVLEKNDIRSEPTYIGGEKTELMRLGFCPGDATCNGLRNKFVFINSPLHVHTDIAFTGVDLLVPNNPGSSNATSFIFYGNGRAVDNGNGRQMILGTDQGSFACDGGTIINRDAHLDIIQEQADPTPGTHLLTLTTQPNSPAINNQIQVTNYTQLLGQGSIHTIYLGHATNVTMGTYAALLGTDSTCTSTFILTTTCNLNIGDSFFSFDTRGGVLGLPELSGVTGQGGIFVDTNGLFNVAPTKRGNISTMVTKSRNGAIRLPRSQIFFSSRVGITDWQLDMNDPSQINIIQSGVKLTDYTIDWISVEKDYTTTNSLVPYEYYDVSDCTCTPIRNENIRSIPEVHGTVDQFQVKRSRLGDAIHMKVGSGAYIQELIFLSGYDSAECPCGLIVIEDDGRVGLGNAQRNYDSAQAPVVLGINGVILVPNGNGEVRVNSQIIVNNFCHILAGTAFAQTGTPNYLTFYSETPQQVRVKSGGVLDLTTFTSTNQVCEFGGQVSLVLETGALVKMNGGKILFSGQAGLIVQRAIASPAEATPPITTDDPILVSFVGTGQVQFTEQSSCVIEEEGFLSIETFPTCSINTTNQTWRFQDSSRFIIGSDDNAGGVFQVGNTVSTVGNSITFSLVIDGIDSEFELGQRGFLGLGAGIIRKEFQTPTNGWSMGSLFNVANITIDVRDGKLINNTIVDGNDPFSSLMAISSNAGATFSFSFDRNNSLIRGGGNMLLIPAGTATTTPNITNVNGTVGSNSVGIMSSENMLTDPRVGAQPIATSASGFFTYLAARSVGPAAAKAYASPKACLAVNTVATNICGYVFNNTQLFRELAYKIIGDGGVATSALPSLNVGAVNIITNADGSVGTLGAFVV